MTSVTCPKCRSRIDASRLKPGSVFACGKCGTKLKAPGDAPRERRATSRRSAGRSRRPAPEPTRNLPLPWILGGAGVVVVIAIVVAIFALGGGSDEPSTDVDTTPEVSRADVVRKLRGKINFAAKDVIRLEALAAQAKKLGEMNLVKLAATYARTEDTSLTWANEAVGNVRFDSSGLPDEGEVIYPTKDWDVLQEIRAKPWLTPEEAKEAAATKERFLAHLAKLESDGHYRCVWQARTSVGVHPIFKDYTYETEDKRPYLVFLQSTEDAEKAARVRELGEKKGRIFRCLYRNFLERFGEALELPKLESDKYEEDVILKCWIFADRKSFGDYNQMFGMPDSSGIGAYYRPADQWMIIPTGAAQPPGFDLHGQEIDTNVSFHEGLHQLVHHYTKKIVEAETGQPVSWTDAKLDSDAMWFQEGVAEWFGSALPEGDTWQPFQTNWYRLHGWKMVRSRKMDEWTFSELLAARGNRDLRTGGGRHMPALFYGQAWALVHFLWNFEDGKYRAKFLEYFKGELRGKSGVREFKKIFGVDKPEGSQMEKEYWKYVDELLKQV
ncbi:MAG: hypothetical protein ABFS86_02900 [Planctomycetota bacterium]